MKRQIVEAIQRRVTPYFAVKRFQLKRDSPAVSITFDDIAKSAWTVGGTIMSSFGVRGTYYVSASFESARMQAGQPFGTLAGVRYYDLEDVVAAHESGHEVGCHSFNHIRVPCLTKEELRASADCNAEFLRSFIGSAPLRSFAYPQGAVSISAKRLLAERFVSCRGTQPGINSGAVDLAQLKAVALDDRFDPISQLPALLEQARQRCGWVIFYGHDVAKRPSRWGCSPDVLQRLVEAVTRADVHIAPVGEIVDSSIQLSCEG
jgi:peptidoglycan/xylan/chitin deacetylase (PgdA/CDA1 family)